MGQMGRIGGVLLAASLAAAGCCAPGPGPGQAALPLPSASSLLPTSAALSPAGDGPTLPAPQPDNRPLPINLATALQLANVRAVDIAAASARMRVAAALLEGAQMLWLPTITIGGDYNRHDGRNQDLTGKVFDNSRSSGMIGLGTGIGNAAILDVGTAIFAPLYAGHQVRVREADLQTASNDTLLAVSEAYFNVQQARGELAGAMDATRRTEDLFARTRKLAGSNGIVPELELFRAEAELSRRRQAELLARQRWQTASAELVRLLRLDPNAQVEPVEPPQLHVELIDPQTPVDDLIPVGLIHRPELASQQAQVQATLTLLRQEQMRPLIPSLLLRGYSTPVTGTLAAGYFGGGPNGFFGNGGLRSDIDVQLLWQLNNLGFGNRALVHQREAENRLAIVELFRLQDRIAAEVARAHAEALQAARRVETATVGLRAAQRSLDKNLIALNETKAVGNQLVTLVRPQEVVAAVQALAQAYIDYYGAVADANRAQFRLYRALGHPAQHLAREAPPPPAEQLPSPRPAGKLGPPK